MRGGHRRGQSRLRPRRLIVKLSQVEISAECPVASAVGGFFERIKEDKLSMGRLDPLFARVLVLEVGQKRLALVILTKKQSCGDICISLIRIPAILSMGS